MKPHPRSEAAFESVIESHLLDNGYISVPREDLDRERAIFPGVVLDFIRETQPTAWSKQEALHGEHTGDQILTDLCKLQLAFFKAAHGLNPELETAYAANRLGITRQLRYSTCSEKSLDPPEVPDR